MPQNNRDQVRGSAGWLNSAGGVPGCWRDEKEKENE